MAEAQLDAYIGSETMALLLEFVRELRDDEGERTGLRRRVLISGCADLVRPGRPQLRALGPALAHQQ
jgi:hypothetical protein